MIIVQKFGGTSVKDPDRIYKTSALVAEQHIITPRVAIVVSAMAGITSWLDDLCHQTYNTDTLTDHNHAYDVTLSAGEQMSVGLMCLALQRRGLKTKPFLAWQLPLITDGVFGAASISSIQTDKLHKAFDAGIIPVIAGFQGINHAQEITTLGRGGSDTTAVALSVALQADRCDIYTDVSGIYTADPRVVKTARPIKRIDTNSMMEMASHGAKVIHPRAVALADKYAIPLTIRSSFEASAPSTTIIKDPKLMEKHCTIGLSCERHISFITVTNAPAADLFMALEDEKISLIQNSQTTIGFAIYHNRLGSVEKILHSKGYAWTVQPDIAHIALVSNGARQSGGDMALLYQAFNDLPCTVIDVFFSAFRTSILIPEAYVDLTLNQLHKKLIEKNT